MTNKKYVNDLIALTTDLNEVVLSHRHDPEKIDVVDYANVLNAVVISLYKSCMMTAVNAMDFRFLDLTKEELLSDFEDAFIADFQTANTEAVEHITYDYDVM